jgi:hypothetical protein
MHGGGHEALHPSLHDHQLIAGRLFDYLTTLGW